MSSQPLKGDKREFKDKPRAEKLYLRKEYTWSEAFSATLRFRLHWRECSWTCWLAEKVTILSRPTLVTASRQGMACRKFEQTSIQKTFHWCPSTTAGGRVLLSPISFPITFGVWDLGARREEATKSKEVSSSGTLFPWTPSNDKA